MFTNLLLTYGTAAAMPLAALVALVLATYLARWL